MEDAEDGTPEPATHAFDLFVVHAVADGDFVRGYLLPALNLPSQRVLSIDQLPLGGLLVAEIDRGVSRSRFTVAVLSPAYLADRWAVFGEQLASHLGADHVRVVPLRLTDCKLPLHLDARVALDFTEPARWEHEAARLRDLLDSPAPVAEHIDCPYPGMRAFTEDEAIGFYGRDREIDDLVQRLDGGEREIYVIGPSGSGKSSLVQAGLLQRLAAGSSRLKRSFVVRTMRPGEQPTDRLAKILERDLASPGAAVEAFMDRHPPAVRVLVFVDQLEELFTLAAADERQRFIAALRALRVEPRCYLVLALRADFFGALMDSALWPDIAGRMSRLEVAPLRGAALSQAISAPAIRAGVYVEARLCDRLVADAAAEPGALPLVQETLRQLWDRRCRRLIGLVEYDALGGGGRGLDVAISRHAEATMRKFTAAQRTIARRVLLRLVSFGEGRADTRRQQPIQALRSAAASDAELSQVLQQLVDGRLVTVDGTPETDAALVDLSHEALITAWPALRTWLAGRQADELQRRRLEAKVGEWIERGRGTASLLDPMELAEADHWTQSKVEHEVGYVAELPALVAASRGEIRKAERLRRRRTVRAFAVLAGFCVVASALAIVAWTQRRDAQRGAEGLHLLEQGRALLDGHPMQALPYFVAARSHGVETTVLRDLFGQAIRSAPLVTFAAHGAKRPGAKGVLATDRGTIVMSAAFSSDGTRVVTASLDNTARVWNAMTGELVAKPLEHQGRGMRAAFSPDGTRVVTTTNDRVARVWDAATGTAVTGPLGHNEQINAAAFSPDGTRVVTVSNDKTARVWNVKTGELAVAPLEHRAAVLTADFSPDGTRVVTTSNDQAWMWDVVTGQLVAGPLEHHGRILIAAFSPDGTRVVTVSNDKTARVWQLAAPEPAITRLEHQGKIIAAAFSPEGTRVITGSDDNTGRVWDLTTGSPVTGPLEHRGGVIAVAFSADGTRVATASFDNTARVWDAATGTPVTAALEHYQEVIDVAFSHDGTRVVTASVDGTARVWDVTGPRVIAPLEHRSFVSSAMFSPDARRALTVSQDTTVWDLLTGRPVTELRGSAAMFSLDGTRVVTASYDGMARVWDATTGEPVTVPFEHLSKVNSAAFSPDGTRVVTASMDGTARVWDATTGRPVTAPLQHWSWVNTAAFSPDGSRVVTASSDGTARVWDAATGKQVTGPLQHSNGVNTAAFSPDGTRVVTASWDGTARVWNAVTGKPVAAPLEHQVGVSAATFSSDGTRVVTASWDSTARVWDAATGKPLTVPLEHQGAVTAATFSLDGTRVVTASLDGTARVWDATTGEPVTVPLEHQGFDVNAAAFSSDGLRVITASSDNTARVWDLSVDLGSLEEWRLVARCSPFTLVHEHGRDILRPNPDPLVECPPYSQVPGVRSARGR